MQNRTVKKYIYYSIWYDRLKGDQGLSDEKIAHVLGIGVGALQRALKYREAHKGFDVERDTLDQHIAELRARIEEREQTVEMLQKKMSVAAKAEDANVDGVVFIDAPYKSLTTYARAIADHERIILDLKTRVMELEGLYKETVKLEHSGTIENPLYDAIVGLTEAVRAKDASGTEPETA